MVLLKLVADVDTKSCCQRDQSNISRWSKVGYGWTVARFCKLGMLVGVVSSVVVGVLYHLFIEKPLIRLFRRQFNRMRAS